MGESRKKFHEYMLDRPGAVGDDIARKLKDGKYVHIATQIRWEAWQASRQCIEVALPDWFYDMHKDKCLDYKSVTDVLSSAGIKIKGA